MVQGWKQDAPCAQVAQSAARVDATLSGLPPGAYTLAIHAYGDMTDIPASVGPVFRCGAAAPEGCPTILPVSRSQRLCAFSPTSPCAAETSRQL